jgi:hypothetical protein
MGMFDTVNIAKELIFDAVRHHECLIDTSSFMTQGDYFSLQTKGLDNCLSCFVIELDGTFHEHRQDYEWFEPNRDAKFPNNLPYQQEVGDPYFVDDLRSCYFDVKESFTTDTEFVWVVFQVHVKHGRLAEPIVVKQVERIVLAQLNNEHQQVRATWERIRNSWEWQAADKLRTISRYIKRLLVDKIEQLAKMLEKQAETKHTL